MQLVIAILAVVLGALFAFGGWRFFLILLPFWGFFVGFNLGTEGVRALIGDGTFATLTSWAIGIVLALVFAIFSYLYYYAAIAVLAGTVGFLLGSALWGLIGSDDGLIAFILGIALGAVFAIATLMLNVPKYLVIALTAIGGRGAGRRRLVHPDRPDPDRQHHLVRHRQRDRRQLHLAGRLAGDRRRRVHRPDGDGDPRPRQLRAGPGELPVRFVLIQG